MTIKMEKLKYTKKIENPKKVNVSVFSLIFIDNKK